MELEDDECFCCGEGKVILNTGLKLHKLYKSLFLEPILDVQEQDKLLSSLKICPLCYHKLILAVTTDKLIKSAQSKDYKRGKCMMCSKGDFMLKVVEWDHFKKISNDFPFAATRGSSSNICSDCLFYLDTRHVVKDRILSKFPQLKKNPQLENKSDLKKMPEVKTKAKLKLMLDENPKAKPNSEQKKQKKSGSELKVTNYSTRVTRNSTANSSVITISSDNESEQEVSSKLSCLKKFKTLKQNRILRLSKTATADPKIFMMIPYIMISSNRSVSSPVKQNISKTRTSLESANEDSEGGNVKKHQFFKIKLKSTRKRVSLIKKRDDSKIRKRSLSLTTQNKLDGFKKSLIVDVMRMNSEVENNMVSLSSADLSEAGMDGILNENEKSEMEMDCSERNGHSAKQKKYKPRPLSKRKEMNPDLEENNKSKNSESPDLINDIKKNRFKRSRELSPDLENEHKKSRIEQINSEIEDSENINNKKDKEPRNLGISDSEEGSENNTENISGDSVLHHENSDDSKNCGQKDDSSESPPESNKKKKYRPKPLSKLKKEIPQEEVKVNDENVNNGNTENDKRTSRNEETNSDSEQEKGEHGHRDENMKSKDDEGKDESAVIPADSRMVTDEKTVKNNTTVNEDTKDGGSDDEKIKEDENSTADEDTKDEGSDNEGTEDKNQSVADEDNDKVSDDEEINNENMNLADEEGTVDKASDDETIEQNEDSSDDPKDKVSADERINENSVADDEERKEDIDSDKQIHDDINSTADDHESSDVEEAKEDENISAAGDDADDKEKGSDDGEIKDEHSTVVDEDNTGSDVQETKDECSNSTDEGTNARDSENEKKDENSVSDEDIGDKEDENCLKPDLSNDIEESHNLKKCSDDKTVRVKMRPRRKSIFIGEENDSDRDNESGSTRTQEEYENSEDENDGSKSEARDSNKVTDSNKENNIIESCNQERSDSETENDKVTKNSLGTNNTDNSDNEIDKNNGDSENESINTNSKSTDVNAKEKKKKKVTFCENV